MGQDTRKQLTLRLSPQQKAEWDGYVEESPKVNTLSELMRRSVSQFIATDGDMGTPTDGNSVSGDNTGEILDAIGGLENRMDELGDRLGVVEDEVRSAPRENVLNNAVFEELPNDGAEPATFEDIVIGATGDMAAAESVREILDNLADNTSIVRRQETDGVTYWWKNV